MKAPSKDAKEQQRKEEEEAKQRELELLQQLPPKPDPYFENWSISSPVDLDGNRLLDVMSDLGSSR